MRRFIILAMLFLFIPAVVLAQPEPRDYEVSNVRYDFNADNSQFTLMFTVTNNGGDARTDTDITIVARNQGEQGDRVILSETQAILASGEEEDHAFIFETADFPANTVQPIGIEVGIDLYEIAGTSVAQNNRFEISIQIPAADTAETSPETGESSAPLFQMNPDGSLTIAGNMYDRQQVLTGVVALVGAAVLFWLLTVILRMIFRRPPTMKVWQAPYSMIPTLDPNSTEGRQQAWQQHAQNGTILAMPSENNVHAIKLLQDTERAYMSGWRVTALRLSQYDNYGRVARSETIATKKLINKLNKILKRNQKMNREQLTKRLRPVAKSFVKQFRGKVKKRNTYLPVALDVRFEGKQGEVNIVFELYQCNNGAWHRLDRWEPMMAVMGSRLPENYTYTIHGMGGGETVREFYKRLVDDLTWLLTEALQYRPPQPEAQTPQPQAFNVPDTLSGMAPINESEMIRM